MELRSDATMALELLVLVAGVVLLLWSGKEARKWQTVGVVAGWYVIGAAVLLFVGTAIAAVGSFGSRMLMQQLPMMQMPGMSMPQGDSHGGRSGSGRSSTSRPGSGRQTAPVDASAMQEFLNHPMMQKMREMMPGGGMDGGGSVPAPGRQPQSQQPQPYQERP